MNFLKNLPTWLARLLRLGTGNPHRPLPDRPLPVTRFAIDRRWLDKANNQLKAVAFLPKLEEGGYELSVFRTDGLDSPQIWAHGQAHFLSALPANRRFHGRGDFTTADIAAVGRGIRFNETPPRHGNVMQWPTEEDERMAVAQELAERAELVRP